jgi:hypothetical protein
MQIGHTICQDLSNGYTASQEVAVGRRNGLQMPDQGHGVARSTCARISRAR